MTLAAKDLATAAALLAQTQQLLAIDLQISQYPYTLFVIKPATGSSVAQLYLQGSELDQFITNLINTNLERLESAGIDMSEVIENYKQTAMKIRNQQSGTPVDSAPGT